MWNDQDFLDNKHNTEDEYVPSTPKSSNPKNVNNSITNNIEPNKTTNEKISYITWLIFVVFGIVILYLLSLFVYTQFYYFARVRLLRSQAITLTGATSESHHNFFAAVREHEALVRDI